MERELRVLEEVVRNFIVNATPAGSRFIAKRSSLGLSPASIRNIMGDLEERGYLTHPHISAGCVPTDKGYRYYVDHLMRGVELPQSIRSCIREGLSNIEASDLHLLMEATSKVLSKTTRLLGVTLSPKLSTAIFRHLHIYAIDARRVLIHLTIDKGFVKTMTAELQTEISVNRLEASCQIINERFYGKTLEQLQQAGSALFEDVEPYVLGFIRLFIPSIRKMIASGNEGEVVAEGAENMLLQPEFFNRDSMAALVEIIEEKKLLMHLISSQKNVNPTGVAISIGGEIDAGQFNSFSIVSTMYKIGNMEGRLGIIGPKRMPYPLLVSAVDYTAKVLEELYSCNDFN